MAVGGAAAAPGVYSPAVRERTVNEEGGSHDDVGSEEPMTCQATDTVTMLGPFWADVLDRQGGEASSRISQYEQYSPRRAMS